MFTFLMGWRSKQKKISNKLFTFCSVRRSSARGAVGALDEASAKDWILVMESASV